jgi:hypothetical protein
MPLPLPQRETIDPVGVCERSFQADDLGAPIWHGHGYPGMSY